MSGEGRAPGFYPDPWGTPDERYFDGVAWARTTRRGDGLETPPDPASPAPATATPTTGAPAASATAPMSTAPMSTAPADPTTAAPPGWHPDPWAVASLRYWDGRQWTGHVSGMPGGPSATMHLAEERTAARWAKVGLSWGGPALGVSSIAGAFQWNWIAEHWDELTAPGGSNVSNNANQGAAVMGQLAGIVVLVAGVLFLVWFHRAAVLAASAGLASRRRPGLATASFIIPIVNLWWPYQSVCDLLPANHQGRQMIKRWWFFWIGCTIGGIAVAFAAFQSALALGVATGFTVVFALLAAVMARNVVTEIAEAHDQLLAGA